MTDKNVDSVFIDTDLEEVEVILEYKRYSNV